MNTAQTLRVILDGTRDYDIVIGENLLNLSGQIIHDHFGQRSLFIIHDPQVTSHLQTLSNALTKTGHKVSAYALAEGEGAKTWDHLQQTVHWLMDERVDRNSMIVALGGGVTGDHAGFAAAITLRGLDYIQIPTTLLAQVDSSVGGKTGINAAQGKNLIGAFHQPRLVLSDTQTLNTLPERQMRAGYAEIVKYGFMSDAPFFEWLEDHGQTVLKRDSSALIHAITISCKTKAAIVGTDERENSARALLNFGHTFAHALEAACSYDRRLLHGEAVSIGMSLAFDVSQRMNLCPPIDAARALTHLKQLGLPTRISDIQGFPNKSADNLMALMAHDKKAKAGRLTFILSRGIGKAFVTQDADMNVVRTALESSL